MPALIDRAALREMLAAATPGPWVSSAPIGDVPGARYEMRGVGDADVEEKR